LIAAVLSEGELRALIEQAGDVGLDALVEVHDGDELAVALAAGATIIGVNNRDLRSLRVSLDVSRELAARIPDAVVAVSESGLKTAGDLAELRALGYGAFLIGERFMAEPDPGAALEALLAAANGAPDGGTRTAEVVSRTDRAADARR
jgi:indole-3-glycerol phosphate synthase